MKFGLELERSMFQEWRSFYLDYGLLKHALKFFWEAFEYKQIFMDKRMRVLVDSSFPFDFLVNDVNIVEVEDDGHQSEFKIAIKCIDLKDESVEELQNQLDSISSTWNQDLMVNSSTDIVGNVDGIDNSSGETYAFTSNVFSLNSDIKHSTSEPLSEFPEINIHQSSSADMVRNISFRTSGLSSPKSGRKKNELRDILHMTPPKRYTAKFFLITIKPDEYIFYSNCNGSITKKQKTYTLTPLDNTPFGCHHKFGQIFYIPDTVNISNEKTIDAIFLHHIKVAYPLACLVQREMLKITNFYINESRMLAVSALLCINGVKVWDKMGVKERSRLKVAFRQIYYTFSMLQQYCDINCVGVGKILKKIDKITRQNSLKSYESHIDTLIFRMGRKSRIGVLQKVMQENYAKYAANGSMKEAHKIMVFQYNAEREKAVISVILPLSFLAGICVTLIAMIIQLINDMGIPILQGNTIAAKYGFYLCSLPLLFILTYLLFSINIFILERFGINYAFMFDLDPIAHWTGEEFLRDSLLYLFVWCLCTYAFLKDAFNNVKLHEKDNYIYRILYAIFPICIIIIFLKAWIINLLDSHRKPWFIRTMGRIICTPFAIVRFSDFFLLDIITSLPIPLFELQFYWCTFSYEDPHNLCKTGRHRFVAILNVWPFFYRCMQCLRRYTDESRDTRKPFPNLINAGKYASTVIAYMLQFAYYITRDVSGDANKGLCIFLLVLWLISLFCTQTYKFLWDIIVDAGIWIDNDGTGLKLRNDLVFGSHKPYYGFIVANFILRYVAFIPIIIGFHVSHEWFVLWSVLEIFRRFLWVFFRIENEHVNNTESYRATKLAPIPHQDVSSWDTVNDEEAERLLRFSTTSASKNYPLIKAVNLNSTTKFFINLPEEEKYAILTNYSEFKDIKFTRDDDGKKSKFFSELPEETKVLVLLDYLGDQTTGQYQLNVMKNTSNREMHNKFNI